MARQTKTKTKRKTSPKRQPTRKPVSPPADPPNWRVAFLAAYASRSVEDREYLYRTALLIEHLNVAFDWLRDDSHLDPKHRDAFQRDFRRFVDTVWREAHRGEPARLSAMALCHALERARPAAVIPELRLRGYVRLAEGLDVKTVERAHAAWHDLSRGMRPGRVGKFAQVARIVGSVGFKVSASTIERLWRNNQGYGWPPGARDHIRASRAAGTTAVTKVSMSQDGRPIVEPG